MAVMKLMLAFSGASDPVNDRGSVDFFVSGALQLVLAGAALYGARKLRQPLAKENHTESGSTR